MLMGTQNKAGFLCRPRLSKEALPLLRLPCKCSTQRALLPLVAHMLLHCP